MSGKARTGRLTGLACAAIALTCMSACCTKKVAQLGRVNEVPSDVMRIAFDDDMSVLTIDYQATVFTEGNLAGARSVRRRLCIPYARLDLFHQCSIDCSSSPQMLVARQLLWWRNHPDFVLPSKIWDELDGKLDVTHSARSLRICPGSQIYDDIGFAEALEALRRGEAVAHQSRVWLPHGQKILSVDLPYRKDTTGSARIVKPVLYPLAVAGDILLSPAYLVLILTFPRI